MQADALRPPVDLGSFDFIWASPPCQRYAHITRVNGTQDDHPDLIEPTRQMLASSGAIWCIENVNTAPIRPDLRLDGTMFGSNTWRKRKFELSFFCLGPPLGKRFGPVTRPGSVSVVGHTGGGYIQRSRDGGRTIFRNGTIAKWSDAMGIDWMTAKEMAQAIPPAYAEFIGRAAMQVLDGRR